MFSGTKPTPGMPSLWTSACWRGVISRLTQTKPFLVPSLSRNSLASSSGRTAVKSSVASSLSRILRGSAKTETVRISVAITTPLRSRMSGRAAEIAFEVARRRPTCSFGIIASATSRPLIARNSTLKPRMTRPTRGWLFSPLIRKTLRRKATMREPCTGSAGGTISLIGLCSVMGGLQASSSRRPCGRAGFRSASRARDPRACGRSHRPSARDWGCRRRAPPG